MHDDEYWMSRALVLAERAADCNEVPVGAVLVRNGEVVGEGYNQPISGHDPCGHAEIIALRQAAQRLENYRLPGTTLYVTIEPCAMCAGAIIHARVEQVVFAASEPKAGAVVSHVNLFDQPQMNHRVQWRGGVLAEQASELVQRFFTRRRAEKKAAKRAQSSTG